MADGPQAPGRPIRHDCSPLLADYKGPTEISLTGGGSLWRCPECGQVWVYATDNVAWCGWKPGRWWSQLRAKIGGI